MFYIPAYIPNPISVSLPARSHKNIWQVQMQGAIIIPPQDDLGSQTPNWPVENQSQPDSNPTEPAPIRITKPNWILVVPVSVDASGKASWGAGDEWTKAWFVPQRSGGIKTVSISGDADDKDRLNPDMIANAQSTQTATAMMALARKYNAPAVSLAVRGDGGSIQLYYWRSGQQNTDTVYSAGNISLDKHAAMDALVVLAGGNPAGSNTASPGNSTTNPTSNTPQSDEESYSATVQASWPAQMILSNRPEGGLYFVIHISSYDPSEQAIAQQVIANLSRATILNNTPGEGGIDIQGVWLGNKNSLLGELSGVGLAMIK